MILAIETATRVCGAALIERGTLLSLHQEEGKAIHASRLPHLVSEALGGRHPEELQAIAVSIGPGSFTGLRIGLSYAKGLSFACGIPIVAVPTLEAIALKAVRAGRVRSGEKIIPVLDARRDEVYFQIFTAHDGEVTSGAAPADAEVGTLLGRLAGETFHITGEGAPRLEAAAGGTARQLRFLDPPDRLCDAGTIGLIGERLFAGGNVDDPGALEPRYIKDFFLRPPATTDR